MKVTCQSCQAKYTIADEKVRGKVAKIRCKKCGTTIIVNGTEGGAAGPSEHPVADYTQQGANTEQWTVLVGEGDQRTVVAAELTKLYLSGEINYETPGLERWDGRVAAHFANRRAPVRARQRPPADDDTFRRSRAAPAASEPPPPEPVLPAPPMMNVAAAAPAAKPIGARAKAFEADRSSTSRARSIHQSLRCARARRGSHQRFGQSGRCTLPATEVKTS